jgi:hypothetical protein
VQRDVLAAAVDATVVAGDLARSVACLAQSTGVGQPLGAGQIVTGSAVVA